MGGVRVPVQQRIRLLRPLEHLRPTPPTVLCQTLNTHRLLSNRFTVENVVLTSRGPDKAAAGAETKI